jgi:F-type H+-transporting ATPase subunit b
MEAIINAFGIDWRLIAIQLFNFALLMGALWYFLYTPILSVLEKRQKAIEQGVKDAEAAGERLASAERERGEIVKAAHTEAGEVALRAKEHADTKASEIVANAEAKSERILRDAEAAGQELKERLRKESEADIARTALLAAEKILKERS